MSEKEGSGGGGGHGMKKGPWTAAEDAILAEYVQKHGEGNWNSVQKNSGLMRCGKSCRLRWANHLRPNLKKGAFSPEEERTIIELHAKLGNKWARMATQLPGRTDNEIKNYWNTRLKRRQRAGLPIYPQEMREETTTPVFHHHLQQQQFQFGQSLVGRKRPISCCSPPNNTDFPSSQRQKIADHTTNYSLYSFCNYNSPNINTYGYGNHHHHHHQHPTNIPNYTNNTTDIFNLQYCDDDDDNNNNNHHSTDRGRFVFPMSQIPSFSTALYSSNQKLDGQFSASPPRAASGLSYSSLLMGGIGLSHDSAYGCGQDNRESASFDELLMGTQSLSVDAQNNMLGDKDKDVPSSGAKQEAALEEIRSMDDDLSGLLTNFQCSMPLPDWHTGKNLPGIC